MTTTETGQDMRGRRLNGKKSSFETMCGLWRDEGKAGYDAGP